MTKRNKIIIYLLLVAIMFWAIFILFNLNELAKESGHLVKVYWQAEH